MAAAVIMLGLLLVLWVAPAWAKEPARPEVTLQQAVKLALTNSNALKAADLDIDRSYEVRQDAADKLSFIPVGAGPFDPMVEQAFTALVTADLGWQMAKKSYTAQNDAVTVAVYQAYNDVLKAEENVATLELALKSAEQQVIAARSGVRLGMTSKTALVQAEAGRNVARLSLEAAKQGRDDAYQKFNQLVGLWPEDRPMLVERPSYSPLLIDNLDVEVERALEASPIIAIAEENISMKKAVRQVSYFIQPYAVSRIDVDKAEYDAAQTRDQTRQAVRSLYYAVRGLEEQYRALDENRKVAAEALRVIRVKYEVGMATRIELLAAEAALAEVEKNLFDLECRHEVLKLAFEKPWGWAMAVSSGSSGGSTQAGAPGSG